MEREFRARPVVYLILGAVLFGPPWVIVLTGGAPKIPPLLLGIPVILFALGAFWYARFRLVISPEAVTYSSLFGGKKRILRSAIVSASQEGVSADSPGPFVLRSADGSELQVSINVFGRDAASALASLVPRESGS